MEYGTSLYLFKGETGIDISGLVESIKWKGRKSSFARGITVKLIDDDGYKHARAGIDVEQGHQCIFHCDGEELFRGIIMTETASNKKTMTFTAYDNAIYLSNNKDTFTYEDKTASDIFRDVCARFNIPIGIVDECTYRIPELTKSKTTAHDVLADALSLDYENTGVRHYIYSSGGKLNLITRRKNILQWVLEADRNIITYSYTRSIEDIVTRVKMLSDEGTVLAESRNAALESKIGVFQDIDRPDETLNEAQIKELCDSILSEKSSPQKTLSLDVLGHPDIVTGIGVYVIIPHLDLSGTFYVDEDTHTFSDNYHKLSVKLTHAGDITDGAADETETGNYQIGDIVQFKGGSHYASSSSSKPSGTVCAAGPAKVTLHAPGAKHPWHIIHTDNQSRVYGWVDDSSISKE